MLHIRSVPSRTPSPGTSQTDAAAIVTASSNGDISSAGSGTPLEFHNPLRLGGRALEGVVLSARESSRHSRGRNFAAPFVGDVRHLKQRGGTTRLNCGHQSHCWLLADKINMDNVLILCGLSRMGACLRSSFFFTLDVFPTLVLRNANVHLSCNCIQSTVHAGACQLSSYQTRYWDPMLFYRWPSVRDPGPTVKQHWVDVLCFMESLFLDNTAIQCCLNVGH